ncbi:transglycosylase SLT domain-containing protein [Solibacillus sp. MA9]|uniref:Transglycosylase SLT domain-containing protein n=1 Tax=Solibacillus palustris TaxID=2908203 RepID=A0ABS9U8P1_9BACL|nr:transglycosylase SLT domain-containing protein [Solibacillus sp. MA9]MCH7320704.1 transglycosylase SLT domain-containing protein [Solibacillus sp. MA9]
MDISSMKTLLELQALQNLNTTDSSNSSTLSSSNTTLFSELLSNLLNGQGLGTSSSLDGLGDVSSLQQVLNSLQGDSTTSASTNNYISSFLLNNDAGGSSLQNLINQANEQTTGTSIEQYVKDYTGKSSYENLLAGAEKYSSEIAKAAETYNLPEKLIAAVMKQESNFNASAVSSSGASGLMQLMPSTARYLGVTNSSDPEQNIMGGAKYLRQMLDQFDNNIETALAAYNAGPGNVKKYDGIPPFNETQNYVKKVLNYLNA